MLIDTHCHLYSDQFDADRAAALERAGAAGVDRMIAIGYDLPSSRSAIALAQESPLVWATAGIQPHYAQVAGDAEMGELRGLLARPRVVALGEIGLDYYHDRAPHDLQEALFRRQLALARELDLPVVIHSRDAREDTIRILGDAARGQPGVMHSFSGDWEYAEACLEVGFYLSFSGPLTFKKAAELHEVARRAPLDRILIETDAPYLTPHPFRGKRNEPAYVRYVAEALAELRGQPLAAIAAATTANADRLFDRLGGDR
ncbi:MAG TPA: TatD family hydrolase [Herpetosiphonaceae bacterium]|nr:TatD family hydrolase [Herpetosiphonaceae bacterium]